MQIFTVDIMFSNFLRKAKDSFIFQKKEIVHIDIQLLEFLFIAILRHLITCPINLRTLGYLYPNTLIFFLSSLFLLSLSFSFLSLALNLYHKLLLWWLFLDYSRGKPNLMHSKLLYFQISLAHILYLIFIAHIIHYLKLSIKDVVQVLTICGHFYTCLCI